MRKFIINKEYKGCLISSYLKEVELYSSRSIRNLELYLNGKRVKAKKKLRPLDRLVVIEKEKSTDIKPIKMDLKIVYEDQDLLIINKDANLVVHPTLKKVDKTLANGIVNYFIENESKKLVPRFYNRLDMNTTGLIVVTKNGYSQAYLQEKTEVKKYYMALVEGIVGFEEKIIENPIGRVGDKLEREIIPIENGGQYAKTKVKTIKRFIDKNISLVELELFTGRTHQIRVHLKSIGHPILGDHLYNNCDKAKRQLLHAYKLKLNNPLTKKDQEFEIELPDDMKSLINND